MNRAIDYFGYGNPILRVKTFFSIQARKKMYANFLKKCQPHASDSVLDLGVTPDEQLADSNLFEQLYPWKGQITAASVEECSNIVQRYGLKSFVLTQPKKPLPFRDKEFDILFCSAVLEHVGTRDDQRFFLSECLRVADRIFLTTPNRWFPIEMHTFLLFLHWLPWSIFQRIAKPIHNGFWSDINNLNVVSKKDILALSDEIQVDFVRILGMKSNILVFRKPETGLDIENTL